MKRISGVFLCCMLVLKGAGWAGTLSLGPEVQGDHSFEVTAEPVRNPYVAGLSSLIFPGLGQLYTGKYLKAGSFVAFEGIAASMAYYWHERSIQRDDLAGLYADSLDQVWREIQTREPTRVAGLTAGEAIEADPNWIRAADFSLRKELMEHSSTEASVRSRNALTWAVTGHLFNVFDAVGSTGVLRDDGKRSPLVAGWLAAVPVLGLGQLYNGSASKAGMVLMSQVSMGLMAYNYHVLMVDAEEQYKRLNSPNDFRYTVRDQYSDDWALKRRSAFRSRNTFLWYSIFNYFYWVFDAVVDAHLHDYPERMKVRPDLEAGPDGVSAGLSVQF